MAADAKLDKLVGIANFYENGLEAKQVFQPPPQEQPSEPQQPPEQQPPQQQQPAEQPPEQQAPPEQQQPPEQQPPEQQQQQPSDISTEAGELPKADGQQNGQHIAQKDAKGESEKKRKRGNHNQTSISLGYTYGVRTGEVFFQYSETPLHSTEWLRDEIKDLRLEGGQVIGTTNSPL
jgi:outer membrane biosynthesis protein TonB